MPSLSLWATALSGLSWKPWRRGWAWQGNDGVEGSEIPPVTQWEKFGVFESTALSLKSRLGRCAKRNKSRIHLTDTGMISRGARTKNTLKRWSTTEAMPSHVISTRNHTHSVACRGEPLRETPTPHVRPLCRLARETREVVCTSQAGRTVPIFSTTWKG